MINKSNTDIKCGNVIDLSEYLAKKAINHKNFKYYSKRDRIEGILKNHTVYLSDGRNWNDTKDYKNFNDEKSKTLNFGLCLSFSKSESVAMWMLYSGNDGCMIDYTAELVKSILETETVKLGFFENGNFEVLQTLSKSKKEFSISISDVIYYGESKKGDIDKYYYVRRSGESNDLLKKEIVDECFYRKTLPWYYENECRIVVSVPKELLEPNISKYEMAMIEFSETYVDTLQKRVYDSPNNENGTYKPSTLAGNINWNLCRGCKEER